MKAGHTSFQEGKTVKTITYHYRGLIERGPRYDWREGYSAVGENGGVLYPWSTKRECQREAKKQGKKAVFVREARP